MLSVFIRRPLLALVRCARTGPCDERWRRPVLRGLQARRALPRRRRCWSRRPSSWSSGGSTIPSRSIVDPQAAKETIYGGLIASGLQTIALTFKLFLESGALAPSSLGSPGLDEIRWKAPVRPGDTLHVVAEVLEVRPSTSKPDRGIVRMLYTTLNQRGETVMTMIGNQLLRRRPA